MTLRVGKVPSLLSHHSFIKPARSFITNSTQHDNHFCLFSQLLPPQHSHPLHIPFPNRAVLTPTTTGTRSARKLRSTNDPMASSRTSAADAIQQPVGVLFVCLGNICRSPAAEAVFSSIVQKKGLQSNFEIDSAGVIDYHEGNPADKRMRAAALKRGVQVTSISRPIQPSDFEKFDYILAMDKQNKDDILKAYKIWSSTKELPVDSKEKIRMMCSYCKRHNDTEVPDPYYGGPSGFEKVLDLLEDACEGLLDIILSDQSKQKLATEN